MCVCVVSVVVFSKASQNTSLKVEQIVERVGSVQGKSSGRYKKPVGKTKSLQAFFKKVKLQPLYYLALFRVPWYAPH